MREPKMPTLMPEDVLSARDALLAAGEHLKDCIRELHAAEVNSDNAITQGTFELEEAIAEGHATLAREAQRASVAAALVAYAGAVRGWRF
jgi:hypothetical protein